MNDAFVSAVAPSGPLGFLAKAVAINMIVVSVYWALEVLVMGLSPGHVLEDLHSVLFASVPLSVAGLGAISYLDGLRRQMHQMAITDMLTGLRNRRAFMDAFGPGQPKRSGILLMIDIDHFKSVNDTFGHSVGDACLRRLADELRTLSGPKDIAARIGGEEFVVFIADAPENRAEIIGNRLAAGLCVVTEDGREVSFRCSVGATALSGDRSFDAVLRRADEALYEAKRQGRARLVFSQGARIA